MIHFHSKFLCNKALLIVTGLFLTLSPIFAQSSPGGESSNLILWLKANASSITTTPTNVSQWDDETGTYTLTNGPFLPLYISNSTDYNFNPTVRSEGGTDEYLEDDSFVGFQHNALTFFLVGNFISTPSNNGESFFSSSQSGASSSANSFQLEYRNGDLNVRGRDATGSNFDINMGTHDLIPHIISFTESSNIQTPYIDGYPGTGTTHNWNPAFSRAKLFTNRGTGRFTNANISEVIIYSSALSGTSREQVQSYLALKYGITLNQTSPTDYVASSGTVIWDADAPGNTGYTSNIFGVSRDDDSDLDQRVSNSVNANTILTISMDSDDFTKANTSVTNSHDNDLQFLIISDNNVDASTTQTTELDPASGFSIRSQKEWKVNKTANFTETVNLKFDGYDANWTLISTTDGDFSTGVSSIGTLNSNGEITGVTLVNGTVFTLAKLVATPGGVTTGLEWWVRADNGIIDSGGVVTSWEDQFGSRNSTSISGNPQIGTRFQNFNPMIDFTNDNISFNDSGLPDGNNPSDMYVVAGRDVFNSSTRYLLTYGPSGYDRFRYIYGFNNARVDGGTIHPSNSSLHFNVASSSFFTTEGTANIAMMSFVANNSNLFGNGLLLDSNTSNSFNSQLGGSTNLTVGGHNGFSSNSWDGPVGEAFIYSTTLSTSDRQKVDSYLALKYGITLDQDTAATSYVASDGTTTMWDSSINASYNDDIFGIGKDNASALNQRISTSINTNSILTASTDTDFTSENASHTDALDNLEFVTHANNAGSTALAISTTDVNASFTNLKQANRIWHIQEVGDVDCVHYKFDVSGLSLAAGDLLFAVIAEDANFTTNVALRQLDSSAAETSIDWTANSSNNYMTIGVLDAADIDAELTTVYSGINTLSTNALPTSSNTYLEITSRDNGVVITRVTTANRTAMTQQPGLFVFDTDLNQFFVSNGSTWETVSNTATKFCD